MRSDLSPIQGALLTMGAFLLPLLAWCAVSYVPWIWHPLMRVADPGASGLLTAGMEIERGAFAAENGRLAAAGLATASGEPCNPVFLPAPHAVARALVTAFATPPVRRGDPWLHESLWHSIRLIASGFAIACAVGLPLGVLCGTFPALSRLIEPFADFVRYMPAPAFGALMVAVFGIDDEPKIAIIVIAVVFSLVLVAANTTRQLDRSLLEAAATLGADRRRLVLHVVIPGVLPGLYTDVRIMLGTAWTALIIAELIGATSGISWFINQQGKYRHYENVYAGIIIIGLIGLITDQALAALGQIIFPWQGRRVGWLGRQVLMVIGPLTRWTRRRPLPGSPLEAP